MSERLVTSNEIGIDSTNEYSLRPEKINEYIGQDKVKERLNIFIKAAQRREEALDHVILYGPPGLGKTTLANIIANVTGKKYIKLNAVNCGVKEIKEAIDNSKRDLFSYNGIILMLDEIQALNKKQQQSLLEVIEEGSVTLIASTADNPYFVVYKAILSRSTIFEFKPIQKEDIYIGLKRAINRLKPFYTYESITAEDSALKYISETCNGDMRSALNKLELVFNVGIDIFNNRVEVTLDDVVNCSSVKMLNYDKGGDDGYSILSAFHKSLRGSDADGAIHYLARLIKAGDLQSITRRLLCVASEDVGLAVPQAITITEACVSAALQLGFPEARIPLAQATIYLAQCPKSNSVINAIDMALYDLDNMKSIDSRHENAKGDIIRHTINNDDYPYCWVFEDDRFGLANGSDEMFLRFICEIFHPLVRDEKKTVGIIFRKSKQFDKRRRV